MAAIPDKSSPTPAANLDAWLQHIAAVHPREIELGLERIRQVAATIGIGKPARTVITVAGTNGKGTTLAVLDSLLREAGHSTGLYTSPHVEHFSERILLNGTPAGDETICHALARVEQCRGGTTLSYFEFATLAALWIFEQAELDFALLEVGLGGRLDAVNIIDADIAIITAIDLDHMDWLGDTRAKIAMEKAGILRRDRILILAEPRPPWCLLDYCRVLGCHSFHLGEAYDYRRRPDGTGWDWRGSTDRGTRELAALPVPVLPLPSAATALQVLEVLGITLGREPVQRVLAGIRVPGRWELRRDRKTGRLLLLDVAHNPAAATLLNQHLTRLRRAGVYRGDVAVVLAVMADKDVEGIVLSLESIAHIWYIAQVDEPRCLPAPEFAGRIRAMPGERRISVHNTVAAALAAALADTGPDELVTVTGSFVTVSVARALSRAP